MLRNNTSSYFFFIRNHITCYINNTNIYNFRCFKQFYTVIAT